MATDPLDLTLPIREELSVRNRTRSVIDKFGSQTKFSRKELMVLIIIHYKLTKKCPMDRKYFKIVMFKLFDFHNDVLMDSIFSAFDRFNNLVITPESWILGMSLFLRGDLEEKIKFCFTVYDLMGLGCIKRDRLFLLMKNSVKTSAEEDSDEVVREVVDIILKRMDKDRDGELSFNDYRTSVMENPSLLEAFGYCLPSRPAVYTFMTTFTQRVSTMHKYYMPPAKNEKLVMDPSLFSVLANVATPSTEKMR